jgi:hypothetical protein
VQGVGGGGVRRARILFAGFIALFGTIESARACGRVSDEVAERIQDSWRRQRLGADVIVLGVWVDGENKENCGEEYDHENPCFAKIMPHKILKGEKLVEYQMEYSNYINMCDARNTAPSSGVYAKYYIRGSSDSGFSLIDKKWVKKKN